MSSILLSCYRCDPYGVSEAFAGFKWAEMLARRYPITLCTPEYNRANIERYLADLADADIQRNLTLFTVDVPDLDARLGALGSAVKPGFFRYEGALLRALRGSREAAQASLVWHRTPMSFRLRTRLHRLGLPLVIGPVGGGLHPPAQLSGFFAGEAAMYRLRALDGLLIGSRYWMRPFDEAAAVIVAADYVRDILPARLSGKSTTILDTGVDGVSAPAPAHESSSMRVLFVGRMVRYKAPTLAVAGFASFFEQAGRPAGVELVMVGDGEDRLAAEKTADRLGVAGEVRFLGALPKSETLAEYARADVFLFPSITEATGNVYLEAMAAGLPLITVDNGGGGSIPCDDCSFKVPLGSADSITERIGHSLNTLWADSSLRARMSSRARSCLSANYTWEALSRDTYRLVDEVIAGDRQESD